MKRFAIVLLVLAVIGAGAGAYYIRRNGGEVQINTGPVTRGEIIDAVGSTGTLQAVTTVQVGTQVSGTLKELYADFNSIVRQGQVIARLDPSLFQTQIEQARANLVKSKADLERLKVGVDDAQTKLKRTQELAARQLVSQSELDTAQVNLRAAVAQLQSAQAQVEQAQAALNQSQVNLEHTVIETPIDGIVIQRSVDVGQTVAASLQSPTLFVIAADLTKMQVSASVDEADVGRIRPGQRVRFRVDAFPTAEFEGTVSQIRLQPIVVQNVTTYTTIIDVPNPELKLKPGMTANVNIEIARRNDVVRISNAALRFRPTADTFAALNQSVPPELQPRAGGAADRPGTGAGAVSEPRQQAGPQRGADQGGAGPPAQGGNPAQQSAGGPQERAANQGGQARQQLFERLQGMSPEERQAALERMRARRAPGTGREGAAEGAKPQERTPRPDAIKMSGAQTIDALFAPLPPTESTGRVWLYVNRQLKPVRLRLGISDGTNTELLSDELPPGTELVTSVVTTTTRRAAATGGQSPLMPGPRGGFGGPPGGGGGPRGR